MYVLLHIKKGKKKTMHVTMSQGDISCTGRTCTKENKAGDSKFASSPLDRREKVIVAGMSPTFLPCLGFSSYHHYC